MKRRKAIRQIGLGVSAGLALPWLSSCTDKDIEPEVKYDGVVGIIGAGAAGLLAADLLLSKGVQVKIFEASNRVGGRVHSFRKNMVSTESLTVFPNNVPYSDFPLELGADRVIGSNSQWAEVINLMKVPTIDFRSKSTDSYFIDNLVKSEQEALLDSEFVTAKAFRDSFTSFAGNASTTVQQAAQAAGVTTRMQPIVNSWMGNAYGSSLNRIGALGLSEAWALVEHDRKELTLSLNPMEDVLLSRYVRAISKIQYNAKVQSINYGSEMIEITHSGGTDTVNKLIVTVPVSILKAGDISFTPALPSAKTGAMGRIGMDASMRVVMEFKRNFYGEEMAALFGGQQGPGYLNAGVGRSTLNKTMSLTINGSKAEELSALTGNQIVQLLLDEMDIPFEGDATENIRRDTADNSLVYTIKDWTRDPLFKGGFSYPLPGGTNADRTALANPIDGKLFFAGEATDDTGEYGTVSGALKSGERAANEVVDSIMNPS